MRARVSTTADEQLLAAARRLQPGLDDGQLIDAALAGATGRDPQASSEPSLAGYDEHPLDEPDEWGDLASWLAAPK